MEDDIFSETSAERRREREVDEIWANFQRGTEGSNVMLASDFKKYEILFSSELKKKYMEHRLSSDEIDNISDLSQEFYHRINPQEPLHIVDQFGKEVCPPIPPIFRHLNSLDGTARNGDTNAIDIFHHTFSIDETAGAIAENKKKAAAVHLNDIYIKQQSKEDIIKDTKQFDAMSEMFHREVLHNDPYTKTPQMTRKPAASSNIESDDDVEWD
jgi:hypothetical protein